MASESTEPSYQVVPALMSRCVRRDCVVRKLTIRQPKVIMHFEGHLYRNSTPTLYRLNIAGETLFDQVGLGDTAFFARTAVAGRRVNYEPCNS